MPIHIYNSLTRKKEEFVPISPWRVKIYTCGVTVYDECHLGHARSLYIFDVIKRYFKYRGFEVQFVRNITDIDDKIIQRARELGIDWKDLVKKYIESYYNDLEILGIERVATEPKATENIVDMIRHIQLLITKGYAYVCEGNVYFSVRKFKDYGKLSGQQMNQMLKGARIEPDEKKLDPLDFALWKSAREGEPFWESPWGEGRPGWHIECSVMAQKFLKTDTLDIHAGGRDLVFPHHENEIAQAEVLTGKPFAKYWLHHGLVTINGQKMAKSLGNFVTIKDFINRYQEANLLKLFFLSAHYSHPIDYTEEKIEEAKQALERIMILMDKIEKFVVRSSQLTVKNIKEIDEIKNKFIEAMDDDFNMPQGLAAIFELVNAVNKNIDDLNFISQAKSLLFELKEIFALDLKRKIVSTDIPATVKALIAKRNEARKRGDFQEADDIRGELEAGGIILEDTKEGTIWRRKL